MSKGKMHKIPEELQNGIRQAVKEYNQARLKMNIAQRNMEIAKNIKFNLIDEGMPEVACDQYRIHMGTMEIEILDDEEPRGLGSILGKMGFGGDS